jgi:HNH endonuclease
MSFGESIRILAKYRSAHRCCVCHRPFVEIHHLVPQAEGGGDSIENAAPLCAACHDLYGGNPEKRKALRQFRDYWWALMAERRARITEAASVGDEVEISENPHTQGDMRNQGVALFHVVLSDEDFSCAANDIFAIIRAAQEKAPNSRRSLYLDIDGHRNGKGGFDHDMYELQRHFLLGFMFQYLAELNMPLISVQNPKAQINDVPLSLGVVDRLDKASIISAIDGGVDGIWIADRDKFLRTQNS